MISFADVLPELLRVVQGHREFAKVARICVVRDLRGRVRLAIEPEPGESIAEDLQAQIGARLKAYFCPPILIKDSRKPQLVRFITALFQQAPEWPKHWPRGARDPITGVETAFNELKWHGLERVISKHSWLTDTPCGLVWPLSVHTPPVVAFYSFKGGVGRTTLVGAMAWQLARRGHSVTVLDLDLEAPGIGSLFDVGTERGVIDFIVDHVATNREDLHGCTALATSLDDESNGRIRVVPAGAMNWSYLEKLGRLDFAGTRVGDSTTVSPTLLALQRLVKNIRKVYKPDYILIDSRAGLHDIGGISLHDVAHIDVLVGRASPQNYLGMDLTLQALSTRKPSDDQRFIVVHNLAPGLTRRSIREAEIEDFRRRMYESFQVHVYASMDGDAPALEDVGAAHHPLVLSRQEDLDVVSRLGLEHQDAVFMHEFNAVCERIIELGKPEDHDAGDESDTEEF